MFNLIYDMYYNLLDAGNIQSQFNPDNWVYLLTIGTMAIIFAIMYYFTFGGLLGILKRVFR